MKLSNRFLLITLGILLSMFVVACSGEESNGNDDSTSTNEGIDQVLNLTQTDRMRTMDVSMADDALSFSALGATTEGLYRVGEDGKLEEGIALNHKVSEDGLTWTFELRDNAEWENGDPVTAKDFVYAWGRAVDPDTGSEYGPYMLGGVIKNAEAINQGEKDIKELGAEADGDHTLVVTLEKPVPYFESLTAIGSFLPINQKFLEEKGDKYATSSENLLSNGPFKLTEWDSTSDSWKFVRNKSYWDNDTVKLEEINYNVIKNPRVAVDLYEKDEVDIAKLSADLVDQYISDDDFVNVQEFGISYLKLNQTHNEALANKNIRKAISRAFDKEALVDTIANDGSIAAYGMVPEGFAFYPESGEDFRDINGELVPYNVDEAKEYWEKGLEELGTDSVEIEFLAGDEEKSKNMNEYLANQLETNLQGLSVTLKQVPSKQQGDLNNKMDYDVLFAGWGPDYQDPNTFLDLWITDSANNKTGYSSKEYDNLMGQVVSELGTRPEERYDAMLEAEKVLFEDAAIAPILQSGKAQLMSPKIHDLIYGNPFGAEFEFKWAEVVVNE